MMNLVLAAVLAASMAEPEVARDFRPARNTRGNTNLLHVQPIDEASWIWLPGDDGAKTAFLKFRREFEVKDGEGPLVFDVSADERFYLTLDGAFVARGPNRGTVENWQYQTYRATLAPGRHVVEATVWKTCDDAPLAQFSWRGGFVFKAEGVYDARLTTGKAEWQVGRVDAPVAMGLGNGVWGTGSQWQVTGCGAEAAVPASWTKAAVVRGPAAKKDLHVYGLRTNGWMLFPSQLPDQTEERVCPGRIVAVAEQPAWRKPHVYTQAETETPSADWIRRSWTIRPHQKLQYAWDLGRYICAYPEVTLSGGKGARFALDWAEATKDGVTHLKGPQGGGA